MSNNFITNNKDQKTLKQRLNTLISVSDELKFLVGYFYFHGWSEIYEGMRKNPQQQLKILVGMQVCNIAGTIVEYAEQNETPASRETEFQKYLTSLGFALNNEKMDSEEVFSQIRFFLEMIAEERLIIRKTENPNHAKLYLFRYNEELADIQDRAGQLITGSSNLTRPGLHGQEEFNVEIKDYGFPEASQYFDELWERAVPITEAVQNRAQLVHFIQHKTQTATVTPFEAYCLILKTYLDLQNQSVDIDLEGLLQKVGLRKLSYQSDAVAQALQMIEEHNGCIIADVVGLGKSVIASMIARQLNQRGIIICPPGLIGDPVNRDSGWWEYLENFGLHNWHVYSRGIIDRIAQNIESREFDVVIVDEAHYFRNQDTSDYEALSLICRGKKVILLTATPFNNTPMDLYALIKLFIIPGKSSMSLEDNIAAKFMTFNYRYKQLSQLSKNWDSADNEKRLKAELVYTGILQEELPVEPGKIKAHTKKLSDEIKRTISPVVIRRNRLDLKEDHVYSREIGALATVAAPKELFYYLDKEQDEFYDQIIQHYFSEKGRFTGAIYQPYSYEKQLEMAKLDQQENRQFTQQKNLYEFMRRLLVKRFESSFGSFEKSVERFLEVHLMVREFIQKTGKFILDRTLIDRIKDFDPDEIDSSLEKYANETLERKTPKNNEVYDINSFRRKDEFLEHINSDIEVFKSILERLRELKMVENDPKQTEIIKCVKEQLQKEPDRKIILFSEYVDTIKHLEKQFRKEFKNELLVCDGKMSRELSTKLNGDFNAQYGGTKTDHFKVLLTSDKLSEGFNLNRAGIIINYDIPWNPTRVIQRVGRINRIGAKVFDELFIFNFFPSVKGSDFVRSREIAQHKMFMIHNALGEDARIFDADEEPTPSSLGAKMNQNPEENGEVSLITRIRNLYAELEEKYPEVIKTIQHLPPRIKTAKNAQEYSISLLRKKGSGLFAQVADNQAGSGIREIDFEELLDRVSCNFDEPSMKLSSVFWPLYEELKKHTPKYNMRLTDVTLESKAHANLKFSQTLPGVPIEYRDFIETLINDLKKYHTLPTASIRRIGGKMLENTPKSIALFITEIDWLKKRLGENYLEKIDADVGKRTKEIIITVENIDSPDLFSHETS